MAIVDKLNKIASSLEKMAGADRTKGIRRTGETIYDYVLYIQRVIESMVPADKAAELEAEHLNPAMDIESWCDRISAYLPYIGKSDNASQSIPARAYVVIQDMTDEPSKVFGVFADIAEAEKQIKKELDISGIEYERSVNQETGFISYLITDPDGEGYKGELVITLHQIL